MKYSIEDDDIRPFPEFNIDEELQKVRAFIIKELQSEYMTDERAKRWRKSLKYYDDLIHQREARQKQK